MNQKPYTLRDAPPLARHYHRHWYIVGIPLGAISIGFFPLLYYVDDLRWLSAYCVLWVLSMVFTLYIGLRSPRRLIQRLKSSDFKLCPKCGYQLTGLTGKICCPECGLQIDIEQMETQWRRYYAANPAFLRR